MCLRLATSISTTCDWAALLVQRHCFLITPTAKSTQRGLHTGQACFIVLQMKFSAPFDKNRLLWVVSIFYARDRPLYLFLGMFDLGGKQQSETQVKHSFDHVFS